MENLILAGTYTDTGSKGIYKIPVTDGVLGQPKVFTEIKSSKYIAVNGNRIASIGTFPNGSGCALIDESGTILDTVSFEDTASCYITWHEGNIYLANYHLGTFSVIGASDDKLHFIRTISIREGAGCHQVLFHEDKILIPCLFLDRVMIYDNNLNYVSSIRFEAGTGPRHGIFTKDHKTLYLVSELSNELFQIDSSDWSIRNRISVLPDGQKHMRDTAAIRLSDDEKRIYVSTRTMDLLSVIDADAFRLIQTVYCGGRNPRDFILLDHYLLCANRYSNTIVSFALKDDGTIGKEINLVNVLQPVSLDVLK